MYDKLIQKSFVVINWCSEYEGGRAEYEAKKESVTKAIGEKIADLEKPGTAGAKDFSSESDTLKKQLENICKKSKEVRAFLQVKSE